MRSPAINDHAVLLICTSLCIVGAALGLCFYPDALTLPLALVSLLPPLCIAFLSARRRGVVDPSAIFALAFAAYNGLLLVRFNYVGDSQIYPLALTDSIFLRAGVLSGMGAIGMVAGWLIADKGKSSYQVPKSSEFQREIAFLTGTLFFIVGLGFYVLQYWQMGGYLNAISMDRGERFERLATTVSMPYDGFVVCGLTLMMLGGASSSRARMTISVGACLAWCGLLALQGDRRLILQAAMAVALVLGTLKPSLVRLRLSSVLAILLIYLAAVVFGQYRDLIYGLAAGSSTIRQTEVAAEGEKTDWTKPEESELGGPYISLFYYVRGNEPLLWGQSYLWSLPVLIPRALYPGKKEADISTALDNALHDGPGPVYGWGFNPVAEAYANFGLIGVFLIMASWSMLFCWFGSLRFRGIAGLIVCAIVLQEAVNANRIDFRTIYLEITDCLCTALLAVLCMRIIEWNRRRASSPSFYLSETQAGPSI